jgi:hypothetical protein
MSNLHARRRGRSTINRGRVDRILGHVRDKMTDADQALDADDRTEAGIVLREGVELLKIAIRVIDDG